MLTEADLAMLRAAQAQTFDRVGEVWRPSRSRSTTGGTTESFSKQMSSLPYRAAPYSPPEEYIAAGKLSGGQTWMVTCAHDADVRPGDEIRDGSRALRVIGTNAGQSCLTALRVLCEEAR